MMKAHIANGFAASALALALAGCGGGGKGGEESAAASAPETTVSATPAAAAAADEPAARAFIDTLFAAYAKDGEPNLFAKPAETFEPELAAAIAKLDERTEKSGTIGASQEADPICACQDFGDVAYNIDSVAIDGTKATAVVSFTNFGTTEKRTIELVATPGGWRIADIDGSYRKTVFGDLKQP